MRTRPAFRCSDSGPNRAKRGLARHFAVAGALTCLPGQAFAQEPPADAAQADADSIPGPMEGTVTPPRLTHFAEAEWPAGADRTRPVRVLLLLTVDELGQVAAVEVLQSPDAEFASRATSAVRQFRFDPARHGEQAVTVRIRYEYVFAPPVAEADPGESQHRAAPESDTAPRRTAAESPPPAVSGPGSAAEAGAATPPPPDEGFGAVAEIEAPPREVTRRTVEQEHLLKIPGTGGDAMRAIEVMPGVARGGMDSSDLILRGSAWHESVSYINGVPVPGLYHFGGVKSTFNSHFLKQISLYPGNYSARYGRVVGGIVEAEVREPRRDQLHGMLELSLLDSMALVEAPLGSKAGLGLAARRSNIDLVFDQVVPEESFTVLAAPVYWDYQALGVYDLSDHHQLQVMGYGARDSIELVFADPSDFDPALRDRADVALEYHRAHAELSSELSPEVNQHVAITYGKNKASQLLGPLDMAFDTNELFARAAWRITATKALAVNWGFDFEGMFLRGHYYGPYAPQAEGGSENASLSSETLVSVVPDGNRIDVLRPAGYVELEVRPIERLTIVPGVRVDYYSDHDSVTVDPRLSTRWAVTDSTTLKGGVGLYSQSAQYYELLEDFGNPELDPFHALHTSLGFEQRLGESLEVNVEGFYKRLYDRIVATPGGEPPAFRNDGEGRIYGLEIGARYQTENTVAWLAYTLQRSERQDLDDPWRLFEKDQPHVLSLVATQQLGRGWEFGGRFRLSSGDPYTPVVAGVYDAALDTYRALEGPPFSERDPMFHQLDLRIEKQWTFRVWKLATYLDVQNAYNAKNYQGMSYSYDYREREAIQGLPIFPNLGVRGEF